MVSKNMGGNLLNPLSNSKPIHVVLTIDPDLMDNNLLRAYEEMYRFFNLHVIIMGNHPEKGPTLETAKTFLRISAPAFNYSIATNILVKEIESSYGSQDLVFLTNFFDVLNVLEVDYSDHPFYNLDLNDEFLSIRTYNIPNHLSEEKELHSKGVISSCSKLMQITIRQERASPGDNLILCKIQNFIDCGGFEERFFTIKTRSYLIEKFQKFGLLEIPSDHYGLTLIVPSLEDLIKEDKRILQDVVTPIDEQSLFISNNYNSKWGTIDSIKNITKSGIMPSFKKKIQTTLLLDFPIKIRLTKTVEYVTEELFYNSKILNKPHTFPINKSTKRLPIRTRARILRRNSNERIPVRTTKREPLPSKEITEPPTIVNKESHNLKRLRRESENLSISSKSYKSKSLKKPIEIEQSVYTQSNIPKKTLEFKKRTIKMPKTILEKPQTPNEKSTHIEKLKIVKAVILPKPIIKTETTKPTPPKIEPPKIIKPRPRIISDKKTIFEKRKLNPNLQFNRKEENKEND